MNQKTRDTIQTIPNMMYVRLKVTISLYLSPNSRTKQMHRTWCDTERQCSVHCGMPPVLAKADSPTSNLPWIDFDLFGRLHVLFLPKLFINDVCQEYHLIPFRIQVISRATER